MQQEISNNSAVMLWLSYTGAFLLIASCFTPWLDLSIRGVDEVSVYQTFVLGLCCVVVVSMLMSWQSLTLICGALCLILTLSALANLALLQNNLTGLVFENDQYSMITGFSKAYFVPNLNSDPHLASGLHLDTFMERLAAGLFFQGPGWWLCLSAGLLLTISTVHMVKRAKLTMLVLSCLFFFPATSSGAGKSSQYRWESEKKAVILGDYAGADAFFRRIVEEGSYLYDKEKALLALGEIALLTGQKNSPEALFYQGQKYFSRKDFDQALGQLLLAYEQSGGGQKEIVAKHLAATLVETGLMQYRAKSIGPAIVDWKRALAINPGQFSAYFFLGKGYYDLQDYEQSLDHYQHLYDLSTNRLLRANLMAGIGDNYWKQKNFNEARAAYQTAIRLDSKGNLRIIKDLGGT